MQFTEPWDASFMTLPILFLLLLLEDFRSWCSLSQWAFGYHLLMLAMGLCFA